MSSRGGGGAWLTVILWLVVIGIIIEIVKMIVAVIGLTLILAVALIAVAIAIHGLARFCDDIGNKRSVVLKSIVPICLIGLLTLLCGPKLLSLFSTETGMLWWRRTEISYFKLVPFIMFSFPVVFGLGYALAGMFSVSEKNEPRVILIPKNDG